MLLFSFVASLTCFAAGVIFSVQVKTYFAGLPAQARAEVKAIGDKALADAKSKLGII